MILCLLTRALADGHQQAGPMPLCVLTSSICTQRSHLFVYTISLTALVYRLCGESYRLLALLVATFEASNLQADRVAVDQGLSMLQANLIFGL